jgi:hypothetical protein
MTSGNVLMTKIATSKDSRITSKIPELLNELSRMDQPAMVELLLKRPDIVDWSSNTPSKCIMTLQQYQHMMYLFSSNSLLRGFEQPTKEVFVQHVLKHREAILSSSQIDTSSALIEAAIDLTMDLNSAKTMLQDERVQKRISLRARSIRLICAFAQEEFFTIYLDSSIIHLFSSSDLCEIFKLLPIEDLPRGLKLLHERQVLDKLSNDLFHLFAQRAISEDEELVVDTMIEIKPIFIRLPESTKQQLLDYKKHRV